MHINKHIRYGTIGLLAGTMSSCFLLITLWSSVAIVLGLLIGIGYAEAFRARRYAYIDGMLTMAAAGVASWEVISVILLPLLSGQLPQWTDTEMRQLFPAFVGWVLYGASVGPFTQAFNDLAIVLFDNDYHPPASQAEIKTCIVIVGGGFAGVQTAQDLEKAFGADPHVSLTIVSDTNALLFTPMLAEVAGGSLEPAHICRPVRTSLRRTQIVHGRAEWIDVEQKRVLYVPMANSSQMRELPFDHLVLAVGSVSHYLGLPGVEASAFNFKSLRDAMRIRNHVIDMLENADQEPHAERRKAMLTFVIAGAGFAGAELTGALNDFVRGALPYYPNIPPDEVKIVAVHPRDSILPELSRSLADYALERMRARGVTFKLATRVASARPGVVILNPREIIRTETLIWTAGVRPHPLAQALPTLHDKRGAVVVDSHLAVTGLPGIWALGDCAVITNSQTGQPYPATAQYALREAHTLAHNIHASVHGKPQKSFHFTALGMLCVVGHHTACAEIKGWRFSGFLAWFLWRSIYLSKLPGMERKVRVVFDWTAELFFPRDMVQTVETDTWRDISETNRKMKPIKLSDIGKQLWPPDIFSPRNLR